MDVNSGRIVSSSQTIESMGLEMFHRILAVASGEKACAESLRLLNQLALFNPGPVT